MCTHVGICELSESQDFWERCIANRCIANRWKGQSHPGGTSSNQFVTQQLWSFPDLINYYGKFFPNLANTLAPLYSLLQKVNDWSWGICLSKAKKQLTSENLLIYYDPSKELLLACDASPYGIISVLSHHLQDGTDQPIAFATHLLFKAERGYAHLDKEGLAIVYGVKNSISIFMVTSSS